MNLAHHDRRPQTFRLLTILAALAAMQVVAICTQPDGPWFRGELDDFKRDLIGASAVAEGRSPYQRLGELMELPDVEMQEQWVAHTPASIVLAMAVLEAAGGVDSAALAARLATAGLVLATLLVGIWSRKRWLVAVPLLAVATASFAYNWLWSQHGVVVAILLACALKLDSAGRRSAVVLILGLIVSLKPWLLPVAAFMPSSRSALRDVFFVGATATAATLSCLPAIGGWTTLRDWLMVSLPSSYEQWIGSIGNQSLTADVPELLSFMLFLLIPLGIALAVRNRIPRHLWPIVAWLCIHTLPRLVWNHYLVDASPLILFSLLLAPDGYRRGPILVGLATALPSTLALWSPPELVGTTGLVLARGVGVIVLSAAMLTTIRQWWRPDRRLRVLDRALALLGAGSGVPPRSTPG